MHLTADLTPAIELIVLSDRPPMPQLALHPLKHVPDQHRVIASTLVVDLTPHNYDTIVS